MHTSTTALPTSTDILIIGGGMTGLALACALAQRTSLSITILESQAEKISTINDAPTAPYHHRISAISLASQRILARLQVWEGVQQTRVSPFTKIEVCDAVSHSEIQFDSRDIAMPLLGYIIENNLLQAALFEKVKHYPQIQFVANTIPLTLTEHSQYIDITTKNNIHYRTKLLIGAEGANSWVRMQAGIQLQQQDYQQTAIVATVKTALPHQQIARQVFVGDKVLAFLPLADAHTSSIVWSLPTEKAADYMTMEVTQFQQQLTQHCSPKLGDITHCDQRFSFPLKKQQVENYVRPRIALVGDAAHTVHPLAGQGVNIGLLDAASLVDVIVTAIVQQRDIASVATLRRYERWRKADNAALLSGIDIIKNIFANNHKTMTQLRALGLNTLDRATWIKNIFTRHAVGNREGLPLLARE